MPDQKISDLTAATVIEATDHFVVSRGSSNLKVPGSLLITSWELANETWTYASSTTFTVSGDVTAKYSKGTRIKLTQTTVKYFVVTNSSYGAPNTTVTITGGDDYTLANAAITENYYSYLTNPQGYPGFFNYTPSYTGFSANPSGGVHRFSILHRRCFVAIHPSTPGTSNTTGYTTSVPIASSNGITFWSYARVVNNGLDATAPGMCELANGATTVTVYRDWAGGSWTASGNKVARFDIEYYI